MYKLIVTHSGKAHRDDFLVCCIVLANGNQACQVVRRNPTEEELNDANVFVLDVGGRHEPDLSNYDHHHFGRDAKPTCALTLYLKDYNIDGMMRRLGWLEPMEVLDSKGPMAYAKEFGVNSENVFKTFSPVESAMLALFGQVENVKPGEALHEMMLAIGFRLLCDMTDLDNAFHVLDKQAWVTTVKGIKVFVNNSSDNTGVREYLKEHFPNVAVSLCYDDRGPGWTMFRYDDHPGVDLSKLEGFSQMAFVHKGGFIAKTKERAPVEAVLDWVGMAVKE